MTPLAPASFSVQKGAGRIGLRASEFAVTADAEDFSATTKPEYRPTYLRLACDEITIGEQSGTVERESH